MKIIFSLFFILLLSSECRQDDLLKVNLVQDNISISYEASARGFYEKTLVTKDSVLFSNDRNLKEIEVSKCKVEDWNELLALLKAIDVNSLSKLEAPTKKHQVDAAALATFSVKINDETYETKVFDHGHPPKTILNLVNKVLSIKEEMAKH